MPDVRNFEKEMKRGNVRAIGENDGKGARVAKGKAKEVGADASVPRNIKQLNLKTYKWHSLVDYVQAIKSYGTTDNYTTQTVSLRHLV